MQVVPAPKRRPATGILIGAVVIAAVGAVLLTVMGYRADSSSTPLPQWQFVVPWVVFAVGVVATFVALVSIGRRGKVWAWITLGVLSIPVLAVASTFLVVATIG